MRVVLVDDQPLFRAGLRAMLETHQIDVVGEGQNGHDAVELVRVLRPDVVLMDLSMPDLDGLAATRLISANFSDAKVVILTASEEEAYLFDAIKSGAQGYLLKNLSADELIQHLRNVAAGEPALTSELARKLLSELTRPATHAHRGSDAPDALTEREQEVLGLLVQGITSNHELADRLTVTENTVKYHLRNILAKLHVQNRAQVVAYAMRHGMVHQPPLEPS